MKGFSCAMRILYQYHAEQIKRYAGIQVEAYLPLCPLIWRHIEEIAEN
jgi:hypothetical protein